MSTWFVRSTFVLAAFTALPFPALGAPPQVLGQQGDIPVPGHYLAGGPYALDLAVYRPGTGTWIVKRYSNNDQIVQQFGIRYDVPAPGDYDGDGLTDFAVWRPRARMFYVMGSAGVDLQQRLGEAGDIPVPSDYDGDGTTNFAMFRPSTGDWHIVDDDTGLEYVIHWGDAGDVPLPGGYDGYMGDDYAVFHPATGEWRIASSDPQGPAWNVVWGQAGDQFTTAHFDCYYSGPAYFRPVTHGWGVLVNPSLQPWGDPGDINVAGDYTGSFAADQAIWRPATGEWWVLENPMGCIF